MRSIKRKLAAFGAAAVMLAAGTTMSASAVTQEKSHQVTNDYLNSLQSYYYDSTNNKITVRNLTICRKDNYTAIFSACEVRSPDGGTYTNGADFKPAADKGTIAVAQTSKTGKPSDYRAYYRSFVRDENGDNKGEIIRVRHFTF